MYSPTDMQTWLYTPRYGRVANVNIKKKTTHPYSCTGSEVREQHYGQVQEGGRDRWAQPGTGNDGQAQLGTAGQM